MNAAQEFLDLSRDYLQNDYLPKIRMALDELPEDDLWWSPNEQSNSIGHLLLHLAGNLRQWVLVGLAGQEDRRQRALEFAPEKRPDRDQLVSALEGTIGEVVSFLATADPAVLEGERAVQGRQVTGMAALYHAVEHFSMHTGQILYIVKLRTGRNLGFYRVDDGIAKAMYR